MVLQKAKNGGEECAGDPVETKPCKQPSCPGKCDFSSSYIKSNRDEVVLNSEGHKICEILYKSS